MTMYRSKVDAWLVIVLGIAMGVTAAAAFGMAATGHWLGWLWAAGILAVGVGLPTWLLLATHYRFERDELIVQCGPFRFRIPVSRITDVRPTRNPLSSPALSLDRLRIEYGPGRAMMVSPRDREGFLRELDARRRASQEQSGR